MILIDFIFAFLIALLIAGVLSAMFGGRGVRRVGAWPVFLFLFLILFPTTWAGGVWVAPFGPVAWGGSWLPFVTVGILAALLLAALAPTARPPRGVADVTEPARKDEAAALAVGGFFWLLLIAFAVAIIVRYI